MGAAPAGFALPDEGRHGVDIQVDPVARPVAHPVRGRAVLDQLTK